MRLPRLSQRWPFVLAAVMWLAALVGPSVWRAPKPATPASAAPNLSLEIGAALDDCRPGDAGACGRAPSAAPEPGAVMTQQGLPGARVRVFDAADPAHPLLAQAVASTPGLLSLELARGTYWLLLDAPGRARRSELLTLGDEPARLRVALPRAEPFAVQVQDTAGRPIAGATVLVSAADPIPHGALTDAEGLARLQHVGPRPESVRVTAPGHDAAVASPTSRELRVTLSAPAALDILVRHASGEPAPGALVWVSGVGLWPARELRAGADGSVHLPGLARGLYDLRARLDAAVSAGSLQVTLERGRREQVQLSLAPGRFVSVRVTHAAEPIAGAQVTLAEDGLSPFPLSGVTAEDGRVRLGPLPAGGSAVASVRASGFMSESVAVPARGDAELGVELVRGGRVNGRVLDGEGAPIEGARLELIGDDLRGRPIARRSAALAGAAADLAQATALVPMGELGVMSGPLPRPGMPPPGPAPLSTWVSDLDGNFSLEDVPPGRVRVLARHPDFVDGQSEPFGVESGRSAQVEVRLGRGASLSGRVLDASGRPVERARIDAVSREASAASTLSGADGSFAFRVVPPRFDLLVARPQARQRFVLRRALSLSPGEARELELTLPAERAALTLVVRGDGEQPLEGASVSLSSLDPSAPLRVDGESDARGECQLPDAVGLAATLRVQAPGYVAFSSELEAVPERVSVTLARGLVVGGRVTQARGRAPVAGADVALLSAGQRRSARTDESGEYTLGDVAPGPAVLSVHHRDFSAETWDVTIEPSARDGLALELPPIDLSESAFASGTVVDARGQPVRGARVGVGLVPAFVPLGAPPPGLVETDAHGRFELGGLAPGRVTLSAHAAAFGRGSLRDVELRAGERASGLVITLDPGSGGAEPSAAANVAITLGERRFGDEVEVVIVNVAAGSEAERAGVRPGDVLWSIDDEVVLDMGEARRALGGSAGSDVILELERDGESALVRVRREPVR